MLAGIDAQDKPSSSSYSLRESKYQKRSSYRIGVCYSEELHGHGWLVVLIHRLGLLWLVVAILLLIDFLLKWIRLLDHARMKTRVLFVRPALFIVH
jgi:hypothetical protein